MDIKNINSSDLNLADYNKVQKQYQNQAQPEKNESQPDEIVELNSDKTQSAQELITYGDVKNMTNAQLWKQFSIFANKMIGRQLGGLKSYIQGSTDSTGDEPFDTDRLENMLLERYGLEGDIDTAHVEEGGKYSAEKLSDTFVQFAKNLSGGDSSKADLLLDAVKKGFEQAERIWGGELPEISQKTYNLTVEKFNAWKNEAAE